VALLLLLSSSSAHCETDQETNQKTN
jgi:hypothetical protein